MSKNDESERDIEHELANAKAKTLAAQHLLKRAAQEIEELVESDCDDEKKKQASKAAKRFRRAASA